MPELPMDHPGAGEVWYVSYGSNMSLARMACYIGGGRPPGGSRTNPGARDRRMPRRSIPVDLPGALYFAGESPQWGGGVAFYDHETPADHHPGTAARGYLVTVEQVADVAAQEMYRSPRDGDPLEQVLRDGLSGGPHQFGPGRYETLVETGTYDGAPMLTFTSAHRIGEVPHTLPAPAYFAVLAEGLRESRGWDRAQVDAYVGRILSPRRVVPPDVGH